MPEHEKQETIGHDLTVTTAKRALGESAIWICGTVNGHHFSAKIHPGHDSNLNEVKSTMFSKLRLWRLKDNRIVYHWDRGTHKHRKDPLAQEKTTRAIVRYLVSGALSNCGVFKEIDQPGRDLDSLKKHWEKSFQSFDAIEKSRGLQRHESPCSEVERLRAELNPRLKKEVKKRPERHEQNHRQAPEIRYEF